MMLLIILLLVHNNNKIVRDARSGPSVNAFPAVPRLLFNSILPSKFLVDFGKIIRSFPH